MSGRLCVIATPIGHLDDLSPRAARALREAALVLAEDTRRTRVLLDHVGSRAPAESCHRFNEASRLERYVGLLSEGAQLALVSDGGTPAIADPGHRLVRAALEGGHRVEPIPGPSALATALSASGLPADRFRFVGFLPSKKVARRRLLGTLAAEPDTLVWYEAPHRLAASLEDAAELLGSRRALLARELTKLHEELLPATLDALALEIAGRERVRGEVALVVEGRGDEARPRAAGGAAQGEEIGFARLAWGMALELEEGDERRALRRLARESGRARAEVKRALEAAHATHPLPDEPSSR